MPTAQEASCLEQNWILASKEAICGPLSLKNSKGAGNQPRIFTGRTDAEAEAPILWPPDAKSQLIRKDTDAGKNWRHEEKGATEDEMVGLYHPLSGHEFVQTLGDGEGQVSLACGNSMGLQSQTQLSN